MAARGDLAFDGDGDVRYGISIDDNGKDVRGATGPKLARLARQDGAFSWRVTDAGCEFLLGNLEGCYSDRDGKAMQEFSKAARRIAPIA